MPFSGVLHEPPVEVQPLGGHRSSAGDDARPAGGESIRIQSRGPFIIRHVFGMPVVVVDGCFQVVPASPIAPGTRQRRPEIESSLPSSRARALNLCRRGGRAPQETPGARENLGLLGCFVDPLTTPAMIAETR